MKTIASNEQQLNALTSYVKEQDRVLTFYRIENNFFKTTTTKQARKSRREQQTASTSQSDIKKIMNHDIFPHVKFIDKQQLQSLSMGSISMKIMTQLKIPEDQMAEFWAWNYELVEKCFTDYRSGAQQQMNEAFEHGKPIQTIYLQIFCKTKQLI